MGRAPSPAGRCAVADVVGRRETGSAGYAWLSLGFAAWLIGGLALVNWAINRGLVGDVGFSPYHVPAYLGLLALAVVCASLLIRAVRRGRPWRETFPPGYGTIGAGLLVGLAYPVADVAWREGVGPTNWIEGSLAPSRILIPIALVLVAVAPLRIALRSGGSTVGRWAAVASASLVLAALTVPGAFHPAASPWLESPTVPLQGAGEVWTMTADGLGQTRLVEADAKSSASWATWSPDETQIAYTRWEVGPDGRLGADIWVAAADGGAQRRLIGGPGWQWIPHWSPDGAWIAYTREEEGGPGLSSGPMGPNAGPGIQGPLFGVAEAPRTHATIWLARADGTSAVQLTDGTADDRAAAFSPDGTRLVFDSLRDGNTQVYVMNADGSDPRRVTHDAGEDWGAAWSPDGTRIAYNGDEQIYVVNVDGSGLTRLTHDNAFNREPIWSPDGSRIAYMSLPMNGGDWAIWSMAADGSDPRELSRSPGALASLGGSSGAWGRDGRIVYGREQDAPAFAQLPVRENMTGATLVLEGLLSALVALVLVRIDPPFGAFGMLLGTAALVAATGDEQWRFVPAAVVGGLVVDVLVRRAPPRRRASVAGAASAAALVLCAGITVAATGSVSSPTLVLGVAVGTAALGWGLGAVFGSSPGAVDVRTAG